MRDNPIQFAVVREDPEIEVSLARESGAERALLIGSGGCKALSLQSALPRLSLTLVDPNPAQLSLIGRKIKALGEKDAAKRKTAFNIGSDAPDGLNACGNFESLFRSLRRFLNELVLDDGGMRRLFASDAALAEAPRVLFSHKYWPVAFTMHLHSDLLLAMFGPAAVQHAPPGSYPAYFRNAFERGILAPGGSRNYFLHHVFLGGYLDDPECLPRYLVAPAAAHPFRLVEGTVRAVPSFSEYDLVDLSNIFDWMAETEVAEIAARLSAEMRTGARLVFRQLNHAKDFTRFFGGAFRFDRDRGEALLSRDRSLFYSRLNVAARN